MEGMSTYRVIPEIRGGFTAEVTYHSGRVKRSGGFETELAALDWVGFSLGEDIPPAKEA
jgi:hypothetical protein